MLENTELTDQVTQIRDKIEAQVVREKTIAEEIKMMKNRADKMVLKDRILLERKFHQKEMDRHAKVIRSLDEQLSQLETGS